MEEELCKMWKHKEIFSGGGTIRQFSSLNKADSSKSQVNFKEALNRDSD